MSIPHKRICVICVICGYPHLRILGREFFWVQKKVHWSDTDAAGIVWFPNFFGWFEDAEEELFTATLGRTRQSLLDDLRFGMPRGGGHREVSITGRPGQTIRIGIASTLENPRRLRHDFEMRHEAGTLLAEGFVRVASVDLATFTPRDLPAEVVKMVNALPRPWSARARRSRGCDRPNLTRPVRLGRSGASAAGVRAAPTSQRSPGSPKTPRA